MTDFAAPLSPRVRRRRRETVGAFAFGTITARLAVRVNLAAHHALHATNFVFVHADDGVGRVGLAPGRGAVRLDLATYFVGVFFKDGVHPCLFSNKCDHLTSRKTS